MIDLNAENVVSYLKSAGHLDSQESATATELSGGVSNIVMRINRPSGDDWVIKQSRPQLRTDVPWFSRMDRIHREADVMRILDRFLPTGIVPKIEIEDRDNFWFAMQAIDANHAVWKQQLLDGQVDLSVAAKLGTYLAAIHRETSQRAELTEMLRDQTVFNELRVDPFYRHLANQFADVRPAIESMIEEMAATPICLVLGDFSPKNILITPTGIALVDFETGHRGDPAFDLGFFLSHLLLKTVLHADRFEDYADLTHEFWKTYLAGIQPLKATAFAPHELRRRTFAHLASCMWSRIDATSPVNYLPNDREKNIVRNFSRQLLLSPPETWDQAIQDLRTQTHQP
ncbi:aminoglycoside phosphotransferase family protein [Symmachiella dynata]|uniref:phosphotransferase family protein n=1 Tax=Symmachiella dynata TaxID=2527995 RepID=UPI0030EE1579